MAEETLEQRVQRLEKLVQRSLDFEEIQNVMARHAFLDAQGKNREQVEEIFSHTMPDVSFAVHNNHVYKGLDTIIHYYCDNWEQRMRPEQLKTLRKIFPDIKDIKENEMAGWMKMHTCCTPYIIVAGDGKTAKGTWESPGFVTGPMGGRIPALWMWERYAIDFVKENGKWMIWHFNGMIQFMTPYDKSWVSAAVEPVAAVEVVDTAPKVSITFNKAYSPKELCGPLTPDFPPQPVPYQTFSETFSYGQP